MADKGELKDKAVETAAEEALKTLSKGDIEQIMSGNAPISSLTEILASKINDCCSIPRDKHVMRRVKALKKIQFESTKLEADFYTEVQALEAKYQALNMSLFEKRKAIVSGSHEPTDEESHWSEEDDDDDDDESPTGITEVKDSSSTPGASSVDARSHGIEDFWLIALKNCDLLASMITEEDEPVLTHLMDIKVVYADDKGLDFSLEYAFSPNEWFTNKVLTKSYKVICEVSREDPWSFEGAAITEGKGCTIDWKKGKNLTVKVVKKKAKKGKGAAKPVTKTVKSKSFFNIFSLPTLDSKSEIDDEDELAQTLSADYTIAEFIRDRLVPKAVLFYTGEALLDDDEDDDFDDEDDEDDEDDNYDPEKQIAQVKPAECKNQ